MVGGEMSITDFACTGNQAVGEGLCPSRAVSRGKIECTDANTHAPVGADDPVRPAARTYEHGRTNANPHNVCRGRCPHRPVQQTQSVLRNIAAKTDVPNGRTESSAPTGRFAVSPMAGTILRFRPAGSMWASTPTGILRCRRSLYNFVIASCAGGVEPRPYVTTKPGGRFCFDFRPERW